MQKCRIDASVSEEVAQLEGVCFFFFFLHPSPEVPHRPLISPEERGRRWRRHGGDGGHGV